MRMDEPKPEAIPEQIEDAELEEPWLQVHERLAAKRAERRRKMKETRESAERHLEMAKKLRASLRR